MSGPRLTPLATSLPATIPFVGPETMERLRGAPFTARLGANESPFGPSPRAIAAMCDAVTEAWMYPDPENHDLRQALADYHEIGLDHIVVGEGIDGLLGVVVRLLVAPGDAVVTSDGAYPTFNYHVAGFGGTLHKVPYRDDREDPQALLDRARETGAKLLYLSNPDNPMGSWHDPATIEAMIGNLPDGCLLVLDEAYAGCSDIPTAPPLDVDDPRVIRMRTFSKAHGLAGARVGYAIGAAPLVASFGLVRNHFGVSRLSQTAALAALSDTDWPVEVRRRIAESASAINDIATDAGLVALPTATNFVTIDCGRDGAFARKVLDGLLRRGIFVRMPGVAPLDRCIRVSCGPAPDMERLAQALPGAVAEAS
ncbi:histidinol-phosphate aminotransferase [Palleronia aestuarii]|uniref:histidinol-phosphate transaminase n=1 Tax=Palleronia aestuarii TaxID=568105 RepID=A0A2W7N783_9RHOB|nr:pyridoxal phosphate-dependent aminotransferase [Palleronia aestuarii]PZX15981.1 histidinol-phosphate aminotransferase [Palleronia aestuarii]